MGILSALGLDAGDQRILLIAPPDAVLAEAGTIKPRPTIASTLQMASPGARIAWWPERRLLEPAQLSRLRWLLSLSRGEAWIVVDDDDEVTPAEVRAALDGAGLALIDERRAASATAIRVASKPSP